MNNYKQDVTKNEWFSVVESNTVQEVCEYYLDVLLAMKNLMYLTL